MGPGTTSMWSGGRVDGPNTNHVIRVITTVSDSHSSLPMVTSGNPPMPPPTGVQGANAQDVPIVELVKELQDMVSDCTARGSIR